MKSSSSRQLAKLCCDALAEKKAEDLRVLDVRAQSSITDYLVIATGTSEPHLRALRVELTKVMAEARTRLVGVEASQESGWTVVDAFDVMVHLFTPEQRDRYGLENLWKDGTEIFPKIGNGGKAEKRKTPKAKAAKPKKAKPRKRPKG